MLLESAAGQVSFGKARRRRLLAARQALSDRARCFNCGAGRGEYTPGMEKDVILTTTIPQLAKTAAS